MSLKRLHLRCIRHYPKIWKAIMLSKMKKIKKILEEVSVKDKLPIIMVPSRDRASLPKSLENKIESSPKRKKRTSRNSKKTESNPSLTR